MKPVTALVLIGLLLGGCNVTFSDVIPSFLTGKKDEVPKCRGVLGCGSFKTLHKNDLTIPRIIDQRPPKETP
jgi:hypothetical protein